MGATQVNFGGLLCEACSINVWCSVHFSMSSMKSTGEGTGEGAVRSVQRAVCGLLPVTGEDLAVQTG